MKTKSHYLSYIDYTLLDSATCSVLFILGHVPCDVNFFYGLISEPKYHGVEVGEFILVLSIHHLRYC